jgi:hypothetical protein
MIKAIFLILLISLALTQSSTLPTADLSALLSKAGFASTTSTTPSADASAVLANLQAVPAGSTGIQKDATTSILIWLIQQIIDLKSQLALCCAKKPQVVRFKPVVLSGDITLHQLNQSLSMAISIPTNLNVYALLVEVFYFHSSTNNNSHGYMSAQIKQHGDYTNTAQYVSRKFNWYANTATELEIIPWNTNLPYTLDADLYDTYNTESATNPYGKNYYNIRLVGYMSLKVNRSLSIILYTASRMNLSN